jgi:cytochrome c
MKITKIKFLFAIELLAIAYCLITSFVYPVKKNDNLPPEVVIVKPSQNEQFSWNTIIRYNINVSDKEDGKSEYDEINAKEVLLEVCYLPDAATAKKYIDKKKNGNEHRGLSIIRRSDCFTCHASKSKLIGPSFELIAKRYKLNSVSVERLTKNVVNGSKGLWGSTVMPAHKAIRPNEVKKMVAWILTNGANPNLTFYPGMEGAFKTMEKPVNRSTKKVMVLTASYTDHGDKDSMQNRKYGQHSILLNCAN